MDQIDLSDEEIVFIWQRGIAVYLKLETEEESKKHTREQIETIVDKNIRRTLHHEPRTCETCDEVLDWIKHSTGWTLADPEAGVIDRTGETYQELYAIIHHSPQPADVDTVRELVDLLRQWLGNDLGSIKDCQCLRCRTSAALDRIDRKLPR